LANNPDEVPKLFTNTTDLNGDGKVEFYEKGIAVRLSEQLDLATSTSTKSVGGVTVKVGTIQEKMDTIGGIIDDYDDKIDSMEEWLKTREDELWEQFNAMEDALAKMNDQASWLAGQLNGLKR